MIDANNFLHAELPKPNQLPKPLRCICLTPHYLLVYLDITNHGVAIIKAAIHIDDVIVIWEPWDFKIETICHPAFNHQAHNNHLVSSAATF